MSTPYDNRGYSGDHGGGGRHMSPAKEVYALSYADNLNNHHRPTEPRPSVTATSKRETPKAVICVLVVFAILIIVLVVAIIVVALLFSPLLEDNKESKKLITELQLNIKSMKSQVEQVNQTCSTNVKDTESLALTLQTINNSVNSRILQIESTQTSSSKTLQTLKTDTEADIIALKQFDTVINKNLTEVDTMLFKYAFEGLGYGRKSDGVVDHICFASKDHLSCLLECLDRKKGTPEINGANIRRFDNHCCCEKSIDLNQEKKDSSYLHYIIQ